MAHNHLDLHDPSLNAEVSAFALSRGIELTPETRALVYDAMHWAASVIASKISRDCAETIRSGCG